MKKVLNGAPETVSVKIKEPVEADEAPLQSQARYKEVIKPALKQIQDKWKDFLFVIEKKNQHLLGTYLQEGRVADLEDNTLTLEFEESSVFHKNLINQPTNIEFLERELSLFFHAALKLKFKMVPDDLKKIKDNSEPAKSYDPREKIKRYINKNDVIRESLDLFNGKIVGFNEPEQNKKKE